jgi:hypothetical protein
LSGWVVNDVDFRTNPSPEELALYTLDRVDVSKSPVDRLYSDWWDIMLTFFNPRSSKRAKMCYLYTVDVSDQLPVVLPRVYQFVAKR